MRSKSYDITGTVEHIGETEQVTDKFRKRLIVIETEADSKYPQHIPIEFCGEYCGLLDAFSEGENVTITFNLRGRGMARNGKYYGSIAGWKIEPAGQSGGAMDQRPAVKAEDENQDAGEDLGGLPF